MVEFPGKQPVVVEGLCDSKTPLNGAQVLSPHRSV
jgi:hypothetical protein